VSLENGSRVVSAYWIETGEPETSHTFVITEDMAPNVFIHLSLIQPHAQSVNDLPIRLYGVAPIMVVNPATRLHPVLDMPDELHPNSTVSIKISEENRTECSYTLAIVDEGLLGLTRFRTPDPWSHFYAREALGVKTWDVYDMVIGAFGARIESLLSIGGGYEGEEEGEEAQSKANRFPPMVIFQGPFLLEKGQTRTHHLNIPNYIGAVRAMVVAGNQAAYGSAEKSLPVKQPLMVLATLPRVLGPGEQFDLPVTVFAMEPEVRSVNISLETNDMMIPEGETSKQLTFNRTGDKLVNFSLRVPSKTGIGTARIIATSGQEKSEYTAELDIRNPNPPITEFVEATIEDGESWRGGYTLPGMPGTNTAVLEVSSIPPINLERRLKFLLNYPHGCIEQTTSSVFPQLYLSDLVKLPEVSASRTEQNIKAGIKRLEQFVLPDGSFGYWPNSTSPSEWGTSYAGHFLLEAREKGYNVRSDIIKNWLSYQKKSARRASNSESDDLIQAYRLYTLALANEPELGAMNRLREKNNLSIQARGRLAAAYALSGQPEIGSGLIEGALSELSEYNGFNNSYGSRERDWAMMLETLTRMDDRAEGVRYLTRISEVLASRKWLSTQTTGYCLMAVAKFAGGDRMSGELSFEYSHNGSGSTRARSDLPMVQISLDTGDKTNGSMEIRNTSGGILFARIIMTGIPQTGKETATFSNLGMDISFTDLANKPVIVSRLEQGTDFYVHVRVRNPGTIGDYREMALTQIFPSGWEIRNTRLDDVASLGRADIPDYQDIRDDRVYSYFDLNAGQSKMFTIQLNAAYKGRFYLPAALCEAMYEQAVNANSEGMWVEVY
jgi:uncharacterized protein YfaS (alpha-2-macroglobulin family)